MLEKKLRKTTGTNYMVRFLFAPRDFRKHASRGLRKPVFKWKHIVSAWAPGLFIRNDLATKGLN